MRILIRSFDKPAKGPSLALVLNYQLHLSEECDASNRPSECQDRPTAAPAILGPFSGQVWAKTPAGSASMSFRLLPAVSEAAKLNEVVELDDFLYVGDGQPKGTPRVFLLR